MKYFSLLKFILMLFIALYVCFTNTYISQAGDTTITVSGKINMPIGEIAPTEGIDINVTIQLVPYTGANSEIKKLVTMPSGKDYVDYSIELPATSTGCFVYYSIERSNVAYTNGYFADKGTTICFFDLKYIDISKGDVSNINMTLIKGTRINGTISLPNNEVAPLGGIDLRVICGDTYTSNTKIHEGSSSADFSLVIASSDVVQTFNFSYIVSTFNTKYIDGYYVRNGENTFETTVNGLNGVNIKLIKGRLIQGKISLPNEEVAPEGGIRVGVQNSITRMTDVLIPQGKNSAYYNIAMDPSMAMGTCIVEYYLQTTNTPYFSGYYSINGVVEEISNATRIDISNGDVTEIDIPLKRGTLVQGKITLPYGHYAPDGDLMVFLELQDINPPLFPPYPRPLTYVTILKGMNSLNYTIATSSVDKTFKLAYYVGVHKNDYWEFGNEPNPDYINGYYANNSTTKEINLATPINLTNGNLSDMNLTVIPTVIYTPTPMSYEIDNINYVYSAQNNTANVSVKVTKLDASSNPMNLTLCYYDNQGKLICLTTFTRSLRINETRQFSTDFDIPQDATGYYVKAFIFDSLNTLRPLSISKQCTIQK